VASKRAVFGADFMEKIVSSVLMLFSVLPVISLSAQDAAFAQHYASPLYLNPALTGRTACGRLQLNYRNQWPAFNQAFTTYALSYDHHIEAINSGVGLLLMNDRIANGIFNRTMAGGFYAYHLQIGYETMLGFGMKAAFYQESLQWDKLIFPDMIDAISGEIGTGNEAVPERQAVAMADFAAGITLTYSDIYTFGIAIDHLSRPKYGFYTDSDHTLDMKYVVHGSLFFNASTGSAGTGRSFDLILVPNIMWIHQAGFNQIQLGAYAYKNPLIAGIRYRHTLDNPDAVMLMVGLQWDSVRIGYSFDFAVSGLGLLQGGAHEISLAWDLCTDNYTRRRAAHTIKMPAY
jgi:type IX secretion system PorP/SprF family membrane protein